MSRGGGIDYSKWDHFGDDSASEDDDASPSPRVTRLDQPSRVTFGGGSEPQISHDSSVAAKASVETKVATEETGKIPAAWTVKGGVVEEHNLYWTQDRDSAELRFGLSASSSSKVEWQCRVNGILPYSQRHAAVAAEPPTLVIQRDTEIWFQDTLPHAVHAAQDEDTVDWSIEVYNNTKFLVVTLYKATPVPNVTIWWKQPTTSSPTIALDWQSAKSDWTKVWDEAHAQFRQKVADDKHCQTLPDDVNA